MLTVHAVNAFKDNYIWLIQAENSRRVLIVDPGDAAPVIEALEQMALTPAAILITHHHADHIGGVETLLASYPVPVFGPATEQIPLVTQPVKQAHALEIDPDFPLFQVLETPGHTREHICYLMENKLFCGDTLFAGGCGKLLGGTTEQLFQSLQQLKQLAGETEVYCAHEYTEANLRFASVVEPGNQTLQERRQQAREMREAGQATVPSLMADELATNPFLRTHLHHIKTAAELYSGTTLNSDESVFATLRNWKDNF